MGALAQRFDAVHLCARHLYMVRVPERSPAQLCHIRTGDLQAAVVPEGIPEIKIAVFCLDISAFLECTLPVRRSIEPAVFHYDIMTPIESALHVKCFIIYDLHRCMPPYPPPEHIPKVSVSCLRHPILYYGRENTANACFLSLSIPAAHENM